MCSVRVSEQIEKFSLYNINRLNFITEVFTARYGLSPYITQLRFVFKGLNTIFICVISLFDDSITCKIYISQNTSIFRQ